MNLKFSFILTAAALIGASATTSHADRGFPGGQCQPYVANAAGVYHAFNGTYFGAAGQAHCPVSLAVAPTIASSRFLLNYTKTQAGSFSCRAGIEYSNGTVVNTTFRHACANSGGCSASADGYIGNGFISLTLFQSSANAHSAHIECNVSSGSYIRSYTNVQLN